jgi:hypothetical protein
MKCDTPHWNYKPCEARIVRVIVADAPGCPLYWAREFVGQEREAVEVISDGHTFYLDNEDGSGWRKVMHGGGPDMGHYSLAIQGEPLPDKA